MTHIHQPDRMYRMPYGYGPTAGPRQGPDGEPFFWTDTPHKLTVAASFLTDADKLALLLPPRFSLVGEPVVSVELHVISELEWLAGRGYSMLYVRFPAAFDGRQGRTTGTFLSVLWENLADPILSGREELGFAKLWCELPPPRLFRNRAVCAASWLSHQFCEIEVTDLTETDAKTVPQPGLAGIQSEGVLHYKYIPATQDWGSAAIEHACLTPAGDAVKLESLRLGRGRVRFFPTSWEQMPTQFHIISALAELPQLEQREAWVMTTRGGGDLSNQRRLD
jgi:hypothetical protein